MPNFSKLHCLLCAVGLVLVFRPGSVFANFTEETFDHSVNNPGMWEDRRDDLSFDSDGSIHYANFSHENFTTVYPYYRTFNLLSLGVVFDYAYLDFRLYDNTVTQGAGIIFSDNVPHINNSLDFSNFLFFVWPKPDGTFHLFTSLCPETNTSCNVNSQIINGVYPMPLNVWAKLKIIREFNHYVVLVDDVEIFTSVDTQREINAIGIGSPITANNSQVWPSFDINYLGVNILPVEIPSFPHYSQLDTLWGGLEYDTASLWAAEGEREIEEWGCALTSGAMVLKHFEVKHPVANEETTPKNLNEWLNAQPDGYVRNGLVNWLAVTRYAHLSELAGYSPTSLGYERSDFSEASVSASVNADPMIPVIAKDSNSHFVSLFGEEGDSWLVADPLASETGQSPKTTAYSYLTANTLTPSHTDLSYMMWVTEPGVQVELYDAGGNLLPTTSMVEQLGGTTGAGEEVQLVYYPQPTSGKYRLVVRNPGGEDGTVEMYLYNEEGEVQQVSEQLGAGEHREWEIEFDRTQGLVGEAQELDITPPEIRWIKPKEDLLTNGKVLLEVECNEECDYINFWWRHESETYSSASKRYHYELDNGTKFAWELDTRNAVKWDGTVYDMEDGRYYLYAAGKDTTGNWARTPEISIRVDHTPPAQISGMRILDYLGRDLGCGGVTRHRVIRVDWDNITEEDLKYYLVESRPVERLKRVKKSQYLTILRNKDGEYEYRVRSVDKAGNMGEPSEWCGVELERKWYWNWYWGWPKKAD